MPPRHRKGWESNPNKLDPGTGTEGHTIGTQQDSRSSFTPPGLVAIDVLCSGVYETHSDWSTALLSNMKHQLSDCKMGKVRNFSFGSILSTFFFARVPGLSPRVEIPPHGVRDLAQ